MPGRGLVPDAGGHIAASGARSGWGNRIFHLGEAMSVRLPSDARCATLRAARADSRAL